MLTEAYPSTFTGCRDAGADRVTSARPWPPRPAYPGRRDHVPHAGDDEAPARVLVYAREPVSIPEYGTARRMKRLDSGHELPGDGLDGGVVANREVPVADRVSIHVRR